MVLAYFWFKASVTANLKKCPKLKKKRSPKLRHRRLNNTDTQFTVQTPVCLHSFRVPSITFRFYFFTCCVWFFIDIKIKKKVEHCPRREIDSKSARKRDATTDPVLEHHTGKRLSIGPHEAISESRRLVIDSWFHEWLAKRVSNTPALASVTLILLASWAELSDPTSKST